MKTNGCRLKLVEVCSLKFSQGYFQYETFPLTFIWKFRMRLKLTYYFIGRYFPRGVFQTSHQNRTEFDYQTLRAEYMYVQHIAGCENVDDLSVENWICNTIIQKENNAMMSHFKFLILLCCPLRIITQSPRKKLAGKSMFSILSRPLQFILNFYFFSGGT